MRCSSDSPRLVPCPGAAPADFDITTDFGDGITADTPLGDADGWYVHGTHAYRRAGSYTAVATMVDRRSGQVLTVRHLEVVPNAPMALERAAPPAFVRGEAAQTTVAAFRDGNRMATAADHSATVSWGDGEHSPGRVVRVAAGRFAVRASHAYRSSPRGRLTVTVRDDRGAVLTRRVTPRLRG